MAAAVVAGTVIPIAAFAVEGVKGILAELGDIGRKIAIGVANDSGENWTAIGTHFTSGTSDVILPNEVPNEKAVLYNARKTAGPVATGAVGALGYTMADGNTLGVMFSVPFDYDLYSNWWNAKVYEGSKPVDSAMYADLYGSATFKGDNHWNEKDIGCGYTVRGAMSSSGHCTLECYIKKK